MLEGRCRATVVMPNGQSEIADFGPGDTWYFPRGHGHALQGLGPGECHFLLGFDNGHFSEYGTFSITDWIGHVPKSLLVIGGGDTAMEEATFLTRYASRVYVAHRRDKLRASKIMQEKAFRNEKIEFIWDTAVEEILGTLQEGVTGVRLRNLETGGRRVFPCSGVFVAIGHKPNTDLFKGQIEMDAIGYIRTSGHSTATNIPGVFACGDVQVAPYFGATCQR